MARIDHLLIIEASRTEVFAAITSPAGLNAWWTLKSKGRPELGSIYNFHFDPAYDWYAKVKKVKIDELIEWTFTDADRDWTETSIRLELKSLNSGTQVRFVHSDWPERNDHFQRSSYCWAMYLRCLKNFVEKGVVLPYSERGKG